MGISRVLRQSCSTGTNWYVCSKNGFRGCCSVDPCDLSACPDNSATSSTYPPRIFIHSGRSLQWYRGDFPRASNIGSTALWCWWFSCMLLAIDLSLNQASLPLFYNQLSFPRHRQRQPNPYCTHLQHRLRPDPLLWTLRQQLLFQAKYQFHLLDELNDIEYEWMKLWNLSTTYIGPFI